MAAKKFIWLSAILYFILTISCVQRKNEQVATDGFAGSGSCIQCHERFYKLWAPSWHGKAMQPVHAGFVKEYGLPESGPMKIEGRLYEIVYQDSSMVMLEKEGNQLLKEYPVQWSLGGRNVFTFLAPLE
ncbi:MAG TPA: hypothetical protein ENN90_01020, partial [Mariniphaga anaerophila]|nr:hypothetical protein [Mariniphaga anaerophila]